jgi:hypothetical protein
MRDFTKPSDANGLIRRGRAVRVLNEAQHTGEDIEDIKPRVVDKEGIRYYREGDIYDFINGVENEFQEAEDV